MTMRVLLILLMISPVCSAAAAFLGRSTPEFLSVTPNNLPNTSIQNTTDPTGTSTLRYGDPVPTSQQSGFSATGRSFDVVLREVFPVLDIVYQNGAIDGDSVLTSTQISLAVDFVDAQLADTAFQFGFSINETDNDTGDAFLDRDFVGLSNVFAQQTFNVDGEDITLRLEGFSSDGGQTVLDEFVLNENDVTTSQLFASFDTAVPEPTSILVWGGLLVGFCFHRRQQRIRSLSVGGGLFR